MTHRGPFQPPPFWDSVILSCSWCYWDRLRKNANVTGEVAATVISAMTVDNATASRRPDPARSHPVFVTGDFKNQFLTGSGVQGSGAEQTGNVLCFRKTTTSLPIGPLGLPSLSRTQRTFKG